MDWLTLSNLGFSDQRRPSPLVDTKTLSPIMTPEELKKLNEKIKAQDGGTVVLDKAQDIKPVDLSSLQQLSVGSTQSPEDRALMNDLRSKYKQLIPQTEQGITEQDQLLQDLRAMKPGLDFSPMAALADKWTGGGNQLTAAAQSIKGMDEKQKMDLIMRAQGQKQDDLKALTSEIGSRLNTNDSMKLAEMQMKNQRMLAGQDFTLMRDFNNKVREDVKPYYEIMPSIASVQAALTADADGMVNAQRVQQALSNASRLLGEKGVLTDQDLARIQKNTVDMYLAQFAAFANDPSGKVPVAQIAPLVQAIQDGQVAWQNSLQKKLQSTGEGYQALGVNPQLVNKFTQDIYGSKFTGKKEGEQPQAPANQSIIKDLLKGM
jgi:hypothetical protein